MKNLFFFFFLLPYLTQASSLDRNFTRISFGSCNDQTDDQPLWIDLIKQQPDLWIWAGDNVYVDWMPGQDIKSSYELQNKNFYYNLFRNRTRVIGTWDDHDFAFDNSDGRFTHKKRSQELALDFLLEPVSSPRRLQEGLYTSYTLGEADRQIKVILLDVRYFKNLDPEYPMLGKAQWDWLENELEHSEAKIHFIVSGLPVVSKQIPFTEEWGEGKDLNRMLNLLQRNKPKGVVFLVGDKHFSSIYKRHHQLEFMSSGMTHVANSNTWFYLRRMFSKTYFGLSYGQIDVSWDLDVPTIDLSMRTVNHRDVNRTRYKWVADQWTLMR